MAKVYTNVANIKNKMLLDLRKDTSSNTFIGWQVTNNANVGAGLIIKSSGLTIVSTTIAPSSDAVKGVFLPVPTNDLPLEFGWL